MEKVGKLVVSVLSVVLMCALYWLWLPPLSIAYASGFLFIGLCVIILISNIAMWVSDFGIAGIISLFGFAILVILWMGGAFFGSSVFNATVKQQQIGEVEKHHEERFRKLLDNVEDGTVFKKGSIVIWKCRNCGHIHVGINAPEVCPVCAHPKAFFEIQSENY